MMYYKVKPEHDNKRKPGGRFDIYVANELYTDREITRNHLNRDYMEPVQISKKDVYFFFGARFGGKK